jgi:hypothetical protein
MRVGRDRPVATDRGQLKAAEDSPGNRCNARPHIDTIERPIAA